MVFLFGFGEQEGPSSPIHVALLCVFLCLLPPAGPSPEPGDVGEDEEAKSHSQVAAGSGGQISFTRGTARKIISFQWP